MRTVFQPRSGVVRWRAIEEFEELLKYRKKKYCILTGPSIRDWRAQATRARTRLIPNEAHINSCLV